MNFIDGTLYTFEDPVDIYMFTITAASEVRALRGLQGRCESTLGRGGSSVVLRFLGFLFKPFFWREPLESGCRR